ncbi:TetR/AcrR family transcriptional regulator [Salinibacterium amurskyense]|uniref:TetR/AcrR family transcriptional regulator n=1 Tax=Salinibacterium amurskyense TaxID=205941 RepID=UPI00311FA744
MDAKLTIIEAAARLLAQSADGDISTRAVCEASGIQQPALYRIFGDKAALLEATVDHVWNKYLSMKRAAEASSDPLADLRGGWDGHTAFALANPNAYRLLFGSNAVARAESGTEAVRLLQGVLERLAAQGRLRVTPEVAAQHVMAANSGVALAMILRPEQSDDPQLSERMRESVIHSILVGGGVGEPSTPASLAAKAEGASGSNSEAVVAAAITLRAALPRLESPIFTGAEQTLLDEWLARFNTDDTVSTVEGSHS